MKNNVKCFFQKSLYILLEKALYWSFYAIIIFLGIWEENKSWLGFWGLIPHLIIWAIICWWWILQLNISDDHNSVLLYIGFVRDLNLKFEVCWRICVCEFNNRNFEMISWMLLLYYLIIESDRLRRIIEIFCSYVFFMLRLYT